MQRKLRVCQVNAGGELLQIVCGAPNARAGLRAPLARVGAVLPGDMKIKAAKLRGIESAGMLCSARELGLSTSHAGLMELPADAPVGQDLRSYLALDDSILELKTYANRGDSMSVLGVAREVAALTDGKLKNPKTAGIDAVGASAPMPRLEAPLAAPRLLIRRIAGIDNRGSSPPWLQERLRRAGLRSISRVVDVTNYVLLELGQPMHAYDAARVQGALVARHARAGEKLVLLDEREIALSVDELVIADDSGPVGFAGIMGGAGHRNHRSGRRRIAGSRILFPGCDCRACATHGLVTDAGQRFERGVDPQGQLRAMERATSLLIELCGGKAGPVLEAVEQSALPQRVPVLLRGRDRLALLTGARIADARVAASLAGLGMHLVAHPQGWQVTPPSWRFDIAIEADLVEEVLRIVGFDAVEERPTRLPQRFARRSESLVDERALPRCADGTRLPGKQSTTPSSILSCRRSCFQAKLRSGSPIPSPRISLPCVCRCGLVCSRRRSRTARASRSACGSSSAARCSGQSSGVLQEIPACGRHCCWNAESRAMGVQSRAARLLRSERATAAAVLQLRDQA